ncbi:MAG: ChbG/HpnK family deacetylase [Actinomycetota bacterium]|nr:ChbG/HpnK family deacetylase [Actinomycetota bacterium]
MTRLVVTADDLGLTEGVNRAAVQGHVDGVVTATSLLAVGRAFDHAVDLLRAHPGLDVGAHLAIVGEDPPLLSPGEVPTLVDRRGRFPLSYRAVCARAAAGRLDPDDVRLEMRAQLERIQGTGLPVSHIDTHQHTHLWPLVGRVVAGLAQEADVPWVRLPTSRARGPVGVVVRRLQTRLARELQAAGRRSTAAYAGLDEAGRMDAGRFAGAVRLIAAAATAEINAHPGEADDPDLTRFTWNYRWEDEQSMLTDTRTRALLGEEGIQLVSFSDLTARTGEDGR